MNLNKILKENWIATLVLLILVSYSSGETRSNKVEEINSLKSEIVFNTSEVVRLENEIKMGDIRKIKSRKILAEIKKEIKQIPKIF